MQFVIQTVPQPHVISDWIKSSIPLCTCKIVCQEGKCREMSHEGLIPSLWRCTVTQQRGPMSIPNCGAWKCCICVWSMQSWHQAEHQSLAARGVCVSPQRSCHLSLATGTNEFNLLETSMEIISTHGGRTLNVFEYIHASRVKKNLLSWWQIPYSNSSAYKGNQNCKTIMDIKIPTCPRWEKFCKESSNYENIYVTAWILLLSKRSLQLLSVSESVLG